MGLLRSLFKPMKIKNYEFRYQIVTGNNRLHFVENVNILLGEGWVLHGPPITNENTIIGQAMTLPVSAKAEVKEAGCQQ